jgi:uncharacterized protein
MAKGVITAVRGTPPLTVEVSDLLGRPGSTRPIRVRTALPGLALPLARVADDTELDLDLAAESLVDGIHVRGTVRGDLELECRRCLRAFSQPASVPVDELFVPGEEEGEDAFPIVDDTIELEPAIRDAVLLALPPNPLCREDCRGLCPTCGADRNQVDCGHTDDSPDIRWEALARLRERLEE